MAEREAAELAFIGVSAVLLVHISDIHRMADIIRRDWHEQAIWARLALGKWHHRSAKVATIACRCPSTLPFDIGDPNLSDLILAPANGHANHQENRLFWLSCGDDVPREIVVMDARTVIVQNADGASYAIFARPFAKEEVERLQKALKAEGLYSGDMNGVLDEPTRAALAAYAERRGAAFCFRNPAATMNLLDTLGALDNAAQ